MTPELLQTVDGRRKFILTGRLPRGARKFTQESVLFLLALGLLNASNYVFHIAVSRLLGPSEYGALAALLAIVMVLSVPFGVIQTVVAKQTATLRAAGRHGEIGGLSAGTLKGLVPVAWASALVALALAPLFAAFLHIGFGTATLLAPYVLVSILASVPLGVLQGELRFVPLAGLALAGVAVRLGSGIALVWAGVGVTGAMLGTVAAQAATFALGVRLLRMTRDAWRATRRTVGHLRGTFAATFLALSSFWLVAELDIALARHFLAEENAGYYSSAGLVARALLFLPAAVSIVAFPRFVDARASGTEAARWLKISFAAVGGLVLLALPILVLLRRFVVTIAFGDEYLPATSLLPVLAVAMSLLALVNLLVYFHVAMGSRAHYFVLAAAGFETVLIALFHGSAQEIAVIVAAVSGALVLLELHAAAALCRYSPTTRRLADESLPLSGDPTVELSLVLPCHNAAVGLNRMLKRLVAELDDVGSYEVIVVSDGSTDETVKVAGEFPGDGVRVLQYAERTGKGHALRVGLSEAHGRYIAFIDADGDIGSDAIRPFLALMRLYEPDIVLGSKRHPLSDVYYPPMRRLLSWTYHKIARLLFRVNVRDTQTGLKLIRREVLASVLPRMLEKRYAFDLELLVVARRLGFKRVLEAPVRIDYQFSSQVNLGAAYRILVDTLAIFYRRYILNTYAPDERPAGAPAISPAESPAPTLVAPARNGQFISNGRGGKLRILFLNWRDIRNPDAGGAEVFTHEVAKRWVDQGHDVSLLTSRFPGAPALELVDGVRIRRVGRLRNGSFHALVQRELLRVHGFDVVIDEINTVPFLTPLWRRRLPPVVALVHQLAGDVWDSEAPAPLAAVGKWLEPRALRLYRDVLVITVSESTRDDLERLGLPNVSVVPNGRDEPPELNGLPKEPLPTFLFVGRLAANKRPKHAVEAFRLIRESVPDARLWIVGRGPLERKLSRSLPEGAEMLGYLPRAELYERMARAHCLVVPSVREGWGLVVIEANSVGTPAVGYDVPGIRDSIRHGHNGLLATPGDVRALAHQCELVVTDSARYSTIRKQAREWAAQYSWDSTAEGLLTQIRSHALFPSTAHRAELARSAELDEMSGVAGHSAPPA